MPRYRHIGDQPRSFPELGLDLESGQEFETEQPVDHPDLQLLDDLDEPDQAESEQLDEATAKPPTEDAAAVEPSAAQE